MHIVLGLLGALVTILILLDRLGVDIGWLNPFAWRRRRSWRKQYQANPVYTLKKPMEVTALLAVAVAKSDGEMSAEQREGLRALLAEEFRVDDRKAAALINSSGFLLRDGEEVRENIEQVMAASRDAFSPEQVQAARSMLQRVATLDGEPSALQRELIARIESVWARGSEGEGDWH